MFRLFLIISLLFTIGSCSNTRQDKNNLKISSLSNHLQKKGKSIILVMDFGDSDYQIIEYCDTILTYGIGYVKNANTISNNNIVWNSSYPLIRRKLAVTLLKSLQCRGIEGFTICFRPSQAYCAINERLLQRDFYLQPFVNVIHIVGSLGKRVKSFGNDEIVLRPVLNHVSLRPVLP